MARCNATWGTCIGEWWYMGDRWPITKQEDTRVQVGLQDKYHYDDTVERFKARLVVFGNH